jgi:hypothetical protein
VTAGAKIGDDSPVESRFDLQHRRPACARPERGRRMKALERRGVRGLLRSEPEREMAEHELEPPLVLRVSARRPAREERPTF